MKFSALLALPFFVALVAAEPIPEMREEVARAATVSGTVKASALKCRSCAKTSCSALRQYSNGATVKATCQKPGTTVTTESGSYSYWSYTTDKCYVTQAYVDFHGNVWKQPVC